MKRHLDDGPPPPMMPNKEGLYSRATPASPPSHIIGPTIVTGSQSIMTNVPGVQNMLHMSTQPGIQPSTSGQALYTKEGHLQNAYVYAQNKGNPPIQVRHKVHTSTSIAVPGPGTPPAVSSQNFQRLKVEDALSYLDQVKFKFGSQPQVYNDFLDIMKEFKSQSIDTPGVIQRVSNLFKGHPELIVGFNTFLPPGYKIEVQSNEQGYAFQVSVSMPSPTASTTTLMQTQHHNMGPQTETIQVIPGPVKHATTPTLIPASLSPQTVSTYTHTAPPPGGGTGGGGGSGNNVPLIAQTSYAMLPISQQQAHLAVSHALSSVDPTHPTPSSQPVEFNHAINYVNKIKSRFQGQPDKYKKFLEILHTYQKEQRNAKESSCTPGRHLTEAEVYTQVSKLFEHQEDLLAEFGQFLPDATNQLNVKALPIPDQIIPKKTTTAVKTMSHPRDSSGSERDTPRGAPQPKPTPLKRSPSFSTPPKKLRLSASRDVTIAEAGKYANLNDYALFDKVKRALKNQDIYEAFLRSLMLYNNEILCKTELVVLIAPFLQRSPDTLRAFKDFIGVTEQSGLQSRLDHMPTSRDRPQGDLAMEIDYSTCKRLGASYCALPKTYPLPKTSGRTPLCREVLNDTWVSFPTWAEDSTFVTSRKTIYEEYIYRCEDERFELDVVIETNAATIRVLEFVQKKMARMTPEETQKFRLDDCLGGNSPTIQLRAVTRVYGDKAPDMIDGLKKSPQVAIPVVLRRLRAKDEEWREAQKGFNKAWRDQNEKYYLKSLDHQGMNFKQTDARYLGSKSLYNEIEAINEERENAEDADSIPHLVLPYKDKSILDDAANLLIHHAKRLSGLQKEDKHKMKVVLRHFLPDLFQHPRQELSDDEREEDAMEVDEQSAEQPRASNGLARQETKLTDDEAGESYSFFVTSNNWYLFLRLHHILCERLTKMYERAEALAVEEAAEKLNRPESAAIALRLRPKFDVEIVDYYPTLLDMVKAVLDGNMESSVYEDNLREMFGIHAYIAFTLDKVVVGAVRQLQHIVCDEVPQTCMDQYVQEYKRGGGGGPVRTQHQRTALEAAYQKRIEQMWSEESNYKVYVYHKDCRMTIELLESEMDEPEGNESLKWSHYRDNFVESMRGFPDDELAAEKPLFRAKNVRSWKEIHSKEIHSKDQPEVAAGDEKALVRVGEQPAFDLVAEDNTECRFNVNSYKILFVINRNNILYKKDALTNARKSHPRVTKAKHYKFKKFVDAWVSQNCSEGDVQKTMDWLMGKGPDVVPNKTLVFNNNDLNKTPYVPYNRYVVQILEKNSQV